MKNNTRWVLGPKFMYRSPQTSDPEKDILGDAKQAPTQDVTTVSSSTTNEAGIPPGKKTFEKCFLAIIWDTLDKSPEERALIAKLDWYILSYVCIAYFVKYLDQTNVSNAYVSGMKEDLNLKGNDLNLLTTYWTVGYIIGQFPSQMMMTKIRPSIWLPAMEILWSVLTICVAGAKNLNTVYAYISTPLSKSLVNLTKPSLRFFIGLFEASSYAGIMTLLGNFYLPSELGKRAFIFQASSSAAQMFSGCLQAALYSGMNGKGGLPAWRWLFIFDGIIGLPIALYGFWAIPDSPTTTRSRWLSTSQKSMAIARMESIGRKPAQPVTTRTFKQIFTSWPVYLFTTAFICHVLGIRIYSYFNIWLKSTHRYIVEEINLIPTAGYGLQIFFTLFYAWTSDFLQLRYPLILLGSLIAFSGTLILAIYPAQNIPLMMTGWLLTYCETGAGALFITWINEILSHSQEQRMIVTAVVETGAFTFHAWVPLLVYDSSEAPRLTVGYWCAMGFFLGEGVLVGAILWAIGKGWRVGDDEGEER